MDTLSLAQTITKAEQYPYESTPTITTPRGIYAWWAPPGALPEISHPTLTKVDGVELLYLGIGPRNASSLSSLAARVQSHKSNVRKSTFRRALFSLLYKKMGWVPQLDRGGKLIASLQDEASLDRWMETNGLLLSWVSHDAPWKVEKSVIASLRPALNSDHNTNHPLYPRVKAARSCAIRIARENAISAL